MATFDEAAVTGLFPNRQARTRRAPCLDDLGVWSRIGTDPFEKVEEERFYGLGHVTLLVPDSR